MAGLALYPLALGLALSIFLPYLLSWAGVPLQIVFTVVPLAVALLIYLLASRLLSGYGRAASYLPLALAAVPIFLFPNLRIHSTVLDRIAPTAAKAALALASVAAAFSLCWAPRRMGVRRALVSAAVSFALAATLSSAVFPPSAELASPWYVLLLLLGSGVLLLSSEVGG